MLRLMLGVVLRLHIHIQPLPTPKKKTSKRDTYIPLFWGLSRPFQRLLQGQRDATITWI